MVARGSQGPGERDDDWFADVDAPGVLESDPPSAEDDWLVPAAPVRERPELPWKRIAVVGGAVVAVLIAGLAAGGVFSSSGSSPKRIVSSPVTVTPPTTTVQTTPHVALPSSTLKPGDTGSQVKALQRALKALGYPVGKVDGDYGPVTKTAVTAFQRAAGLTADGIFGPKTLNALTHRAGA
jgi:peptidoglycan hydrolase-like protein with peptidoglycan-binding domain